MDAEYPYHGGHRRGYSFRPLHFAGLAVICVLVLIGAVLANRYDRDSREREQRMVGNGFMLRIDENAKAVVPQIDWDDAVSHVENDFDAGWLDRNFASFLFTIDGIDRVFVLDPADRTPIYSAVRGQRGGATAFAPLAETVKALMPGLRAAEARHPPFGLHHNSHKLIARPIQASSIVLIDGLPSIVTASLIQPDFGTVVPAQAHAPVVVTAMPVDAATLANFGQRYQLDGLHISATKPLARGMTQIELRDARGNPAAWLVWNDAARGRSLMVDLLKPFTALCVLLTLISQMLFRRSEAVATDLIASEARARHLAYHDTLTQLPNRTMMFERVRVALAAARRNGSTVAVHCLDLDRFKEVNDALGHLAGDDLIRWVAVRLSELCRETDTVARLGGDEFIIVQLDTTPAGAALLAQRVLDALKHPVTLDQGVVNISASIGITMIANSAIDPVEVVRQADLALYASKENGRNRMTFFEPEMDAAVRMRRGLEADLRQALQGDGLEMVYQPQIEVRGNVNGLEALIRWKHPELGMIAPAMFIPLAEETGLILELGEFVFRRVFEETRSWKKRVAINVSALQLRSPTFMAMLTRLVAEFKIDATDYEIEITETALLGDDGVTHTNINLLKQAGFTLALDDFGTGYSSLSTLHRFAIDKIKIDRSFVRNLAASDETDALIDAIVQLGRALKLDIVAEGVETEQQRDRLAACGCNVFQGFLLSHPIKALAATQMAA